MVKQFRFFSILALCFFLLSSFVDGRTSECNTPPAVLSPLKSYADESPAELTWKQLSDVTFKQVYIKDLDAYFWKPTFSAAVKALQGTEVYITGYVIPVDYDDNFFVVSRYPYANCYFCGGGGPETVCDLRFTGSHKAYKTDERLTFKGKLKLNADDVYQMNYILEGATEYKP